MTKTAFYLLSFTWGLPTTLAGCVWAGIHLLRGHRPKKWGYCWYFECCTELLFRTAHAVRGGGSVVHAVLVPGISQARAAPDAVHTVRFGVV